VDISATAARRKNGVAEALIRLTLTTRHRAKLGSLDVQGEKAGNIFCSIDP
jgi:hypothetical protein